MHSEENSHSNTGSEQSKRLRITAIVFLLCFSAIIIRLVYIQIFKGAEYRDRARKQYEARITLRPERGVILDRMGRVVAATVQSVSFAADPKMLTNVEAVCAAIEEASGIAKQTLIAKIEAARDKNFVWLARGISPARIPPSLDSIKDPGLIRIAEPKRNYPYSSMASQLLGCTDVDNKGLSGLELAYDSLLRGEAGYEVMQRDGLGHLRPIMGASVQAARNGYSIQLTIDAELQSVVEQELQRGLEYAGAQSGIAIAIKPQSGEVLCIASSPGFNPNLVKESTADAMRLRGITDTYEPGSTFKLVTAAAAIERRLVDSTSQVDGLTGTLQLKDGTTIRDHEPVGLCPLQTALDKSSNIVFASLAQHIPDLVFYRYARDFGFGNPFGLELSGEARGILKLPREYDYSTKMYQGFGYQLACTALQLVSAYGAIANGGVLMKPHLVQSIHDADNHEVMSAKAQQLRRVVNPQTASTLSVMFTSVVERGTGVQARIPGLSIAGKTGTAQQLVDGKYSREAYTASFVGFFPATNPEMVLLVMLDKPVTDIYGGKTAAPIFRNIVQRLLSTPSVLEYMPSLRNFSADFVDRDSVTVPEVRGLVLSEAKRILHERGLRGYASATEGVVRTQSVSSGNVLPKGSEISLATSDDSSSVHPAKVSLDVRGLSMRRAVTLLHSQNITVRVKGTGIVRMQEWSTESKRRVCTLIGSE